MHDAIPCNDLDATADTMTKVIHEAALLVAGRHQGKKQDKLLARMKMLWEKRRMMERGDTTQDNLKYVKTCKAIRQEIKDDILVFDENTSSKPSRKTRA